MRANDNRRRVSAVLQLPFRGEECRGARGDGLTRGVMHRRMCLPDIFLLDKKVATKRRARREGERLVGRCGGECARNHVASLLGSRVGFFFNFSDKNHKTKHLTQAQNSKQKKNGCFYISPKKKTKKMVDVSPKEGNIPSFSIVPCEERGI